MISAPNHIYTHTTEAQDQQDEICSWLIRVIGRRILLRWKPIDPRQMPDTLPFAWFKSSHLLPTKHKVNRVAFILSDLRTKLI